MKLTKKLLFTLPLMAIPLVAAVACAKTPDKTKESGSENPNQQFIDSIEAVKKLKAEIVSKFLVENFGKFDASTADDDKKYIGSVNTLYKAATGVITEADILDEATGKAAESEVAQAYKKAYEAIKSTTDAQKKTFITKFFKAKAANEEDAFAKISYIFGHFVGELQGRRWALSQADDYTNNFDNNGTQSSYVALLKPLQDVLTKLKTKAEVSDSEAQAAIKATYKAFNEYFISLKEFDDHDHDHDHKQSEDEKKNNYSKDTSKHSHSHAIFNMLGFSALNDTEGHLEVFDTVEAEMAAITNWTEAEKAALNDFITQLKSFKAVFATEAKVIRDFIKNKIRPHNALIKAELEKMVRINNWDKAVVLVLD